MSSQIEPINTASIQAFLQQVKSADASSAKEVKIDIQNAKRLAFSLGEILARLNGDLEKLLLENNSNTNESIEIKMDGGSDW
jgi:hypothetical protein